MAIKNEYVLNFKSKGVKKTKQEVDKLNDSENKLEKSSLALKAGIAAAGIAIIAAGKHAISTAAQFESLRTRLRSMYGSVNAGTKAFQTFQRVAATTPFAVKNVVEAGASLKAFGVDAENNIKAVADLAAFMGVDVVEAAQAMGRAFAGGAGAADVLRERGILQLIKDFKGIDDLTKLTLPEFRQALEETIKDPTAGVAGATTLLSETFEGSYSNMMDSVDRLSAKFGDALLPTIKNVTNGITSMLNNMIGGEDAYQSQIDSIIQQENKLRQLAGAITQGNIPQGLRLKLIRDIQKEYPDFLENMKAEEVTNKNIKDALKDVNEQNRLRIEALVKEKAVAHILEDQNDIAQDYADSFNRLTDRSLSFGKALKEMTISPYAIQTMGGMADITDDFLDSTGMLLPTTKEAYGNMVKEVRALYDQYKNNEIGLEEYTKSVQDVVNKEEYLNISRTGMTPIAKYLNDETDRMTQANNKLNQSYDLMSIRTNALTLDIQSLRNQVKSVSEDDDTEVPLVIPSDEELAATLERYSQQFEKAEEPANSFLNTLQKIDIGLRELPSATGEATSAVGKLALGLQKGFKSIADDENELFSHTLDAAGSIGMAMADNRAEQLEIQKFMIKGNVAKGIIDIFADAAGKGPLAAAAAALQSATLIAKGITQEKMVDQQISGIKASKSKVGNTQTRFAQYGMNEVVDQATPIIAGEAGAELVQITPLEGANVDGPQGGGNIVITGNVLSRDFVQGELIDELREAIRQGYDFR